MNNVMRSILQDVVNKREVRKDFEMEATTLEIGGNTIKTFSDIASRFGLESPSEAAELVSELSSVITASSGAAYSEAGDKEMKETLVAAMYSRDFLVFVAGTAFAMGVQFALTEME